MDGLSVCLIVKNEENVLGRCLACVQKFADEIIVVDTGSTDNTKRIAKQYGAQVFDFVWVDDFSKARNVSFSKATKEYVMWLDADDVVLDVDVKKINDLKKESNDIDMYMLKYNVVFDNEGKPIFWYYRERIFKRSRGFKWVGFIHESIAPSNNCVEVDIAICHQRKEITKTDRNLLIYEKHLADGDVFDARSMFYYARELFFNKRYASCVKTLQTFLKMPNRFLPNVVDAYICLADCYLLRNKPQKAFQFLIQGFKEYPPKSQTCCKIGECLLYLKKEKDAIWWYECALATAENHISGEFRQTEFESLIPNLQLCCIYYKLGDFEKAKRYHDLAKQNNPYNKSVIYNQQFFENSEK